MKQEIEDIEVARKSLTEAKDLVYIAIACFHSEKMKSQEMINNDMSLELRNYYNERHHNISSVVDSLFSIIEKMGNVDTYINNI